MRCILAEVYLSSRFTSLHSFVGNHLFPHGIYILPDLPQTLSFSSPVLLSQVNFPFPSFGPFHRTLKCFMSTSYHSILPLCSLSCHSLLYSYLRHLFTKIIHSNFFFLVPFLIPFSFPVSPPATCILPSFLRS